MRRTLTLLAFAPILLSAQITEKLVAERTLVVVKFAPQKSGDYLVRGEWQTKANELQSKLKYTGVDAIAYLHSDDWNASPTNRDAYRLFFTTRGVKNLVEIVEEDRLFKVSVYDFQTLEKVWETEGGSLDQAILRIGREVKRLGFDVKNFVPIENAEIFTDIPMAKWSASQNFPTRVKGIKIGVDSFDSEQENEELNALMSKYPFEYDLIDYTNDEEAFRKGYQYVLLHMTTSGSSIKKLLNYQSGDDETAFISTVKGDSSNTRIITIPADANVTKFYIRHTVREEVFVGKDWDADLSWQSALANFIHNMRIFLGKI